MAKYNITESKKDKNAEYTSLMSAAAVDKLYMDILQKVVIEKHYLDSKYTAATLAEEIGTNPRYISAVVSLRYRDNFSQLLNEFRVKDAMYMLTDRHFSKMSMEDIAAAVGYNNRQCFYSAFYRRTGMTPLNFRRTKSNLPDE